MGSSVNKNKTVFKETFEYKVIYLCLVDDDVHHDLIKIGDTTVHTDKHIEDLVPNCKELNNAAKERINNFSSQLGIKPRLIHTELAIKDERLSNGDIKHIGFRDHQVHAVLKNSGINHRKLGNSKEWFKISPETGIAAIRAFKEGYSNLSHIDKNDIRVPIVLRPEQDDCVRRIVKHFKKSNRFLINGKMRFGKTIVGHEVIKRCGFSRTAILTHRPVVDDGWYEDFEKVFCSDDNIIYGSKNKGYDLETLLKIQKEKSKKIIYFASIQDLRGSEKVGGKYKKNDLVFKTDWDCVIIDEAHEGTTTELGSDTINAVLENSVNPKLLELSGTPFNILENFSKDNTFTWDYVMEQEKKTNWDFTNPGDSNPYIELPKLQMYTYSLEDTFKNKEYITLDDKCFNFKEFFRTFTSVDKDNSSIPANKNVGDFVHEDDILTLLNMFTTENDSNNYPYANERYRNLFKHTLWMVPGVKEARALSKLLYRHSVFGCGKFKIVNVAGEGDEEEKREEALTKVKNAINNAGDEDYTITLSCGKLTTGVTVREWTAVFMLYGSYTTSASNYMQTIFRVQSPCNKNGKFKENAYVFDFAPDRTLKMIAEAVNNNSRQGETDRQAIVNFLNFCPIISVNGSRMQDYSVNKLLQQLKRAYAERVVQNGFDDAKLYNDELLHLSDVEIGKFNELKEIIGKTASIKKTNEIPINEQGFDQKELEVIEKSKRELTEEEIQLRAELLERRKQRNTAISILKGISIRMPLLIYGADVDYDSDITLNKFVEIVDDDSWNEFMPKGVTKEKFQEFMKYYDEDIFIASGRHIRNTAKNADLLDPLERVKTIAGLFSYFKNPDKETVLTPWRVVNMHLSKSLGGYSFWDSSFEKTLDNPDYIESQILKYDIFKDDNKKILEMNSKTGLYPLYLAYSFYYNQVNGLEERLTLKEKNDKWLSVVSNNLFIVCKTPMAKTITKRTLLGYKKGKVNAHCFDDLVSTLRYKPEQFKKRMKRFWAKGNKEMEFDAIVGNPPYQETNNLNSRDMPIYHLFMDSAFSLSKVVSFITPARFLFNAGSTPKAWNSKMLRDKHFKVVQYFDKSTEVFPNVDIKGGVAITVRNEHEEYEPIEVFTPNKTMGDILKKIDIEIEGRLSTIVYTKSTFSFSKKLYEEHPDYKNRLTKGNEFIIDADIFNKMPEIFTDDETKNNDLKVIGRENNSRVAKWVNRKYVTDVENIDSFKVFITGANGSGKFGETLSSPVLAKDKEIHTQTFMSIGKFKDKESATNCLKYIKTKFARALLGTLKVTQNNPKDSWANIPMQNFSNQSDINWSKSIHEIDKQLYSKYKLTDDEISYIEENVLPML